MTIDTITAYAAIGGYPNYIVKLTADGSALAYQHNFDTPLGGTINTLPKGEGGCQPIDVGCIMHGSAMSTWRSAGGIDSGKPDP